MWFGTLALVVALAAGATGFWALYEKRVVMMSMLSAVLWAFAGLNGDTITHGTQVVVETQTAMLQYVFYFLAVVNLILLVFWLYSEPEDRRALLDQL
jgi:hypothetical protein